MGRPRIITPPDDELEKLGQEMVDWVKENQPMHLSQWYSLEKRIIYKDWKNLIQREIFLPYYEEALMIVGLKYLDKNSNIREGVSQRWQRVYFKDLKEMEDEQVEHKAQLSLKKESQNQEDMAKEIVKAIKETENE